MIVKPWRARFSQRTERALTAHVTLIGPIAHVRPFPSATGVLPTNESWLSLVSEGCPVDPRKTNPGSPTPLVLGAGTVLESQSSCIGGELYGCVATPHVTLPPSAVHNCAADVEANAGVTKLSPTRRRTTSRSRHTSRIVPRRRIVGAWYVGAGWHAVDSKPKSGFLTHATVPA